MNVKFLDYVAQLPVQSIPSVTYINNKV